jgi:hypothetical protein
MGNREGNGNDRKKDMACAGENTPTRLGGYEEVDNGHG